MLLLPFVAATLLGQGPGLLVAHVNDPQSHGAVGDTLLSLDEAIRLANGALMASALSPSEQAQLIGSGSMVDGIVVDAAITPTITLQAPLTDVMGMGMMNGVRLVLSGVGSAVSARPVLQAGSVAHALRIASHWVTVRGLAITGGQVAIAAQMMPMPQPMPEMGMVMDCELSGQTTAGVHLTGSGLQETMLMVMATRLSSMPLGFLLEDQTAGGRLMAECERVTMDGVTLGCRVVEGGAGGDVSMFMLFRSTFVNGVTLAEKRRLPGSAQQFMFRFVHTNATCSGDVLDIEGSATGLTMIHHHHGDFVTTPGHKAFWVHPRTAEFDVHGSEMVFDGDVSVAANLATLRVWQQNNLYRNGTITYDVDGALPNLLWNRYQNCILDVPATARSPVVVRQSELTSTDVHSASFLAPITLQTCLRTGGTLSGFATEPQTAPAPFLGTTTVGPAEPQVGTSVQLGTDLPAGVALIWDFAMSYARPTTTAEPVRFYGDPATVIVLPAILLFQSQMTVPIPNNSSLAGLEFYVQGISLPLFAQSYAPVYHLPRGQLLLLRQ